MGKNKTKADADTIQTIVSIMSEDNKLSKRTLKTIKKTKRLISHEVINDDGSMTVLIDVKELIKLLGRWDFERNCAKTQYQHEMESFYFLLAEETRMEYPGLFEEEVCNG